MILTKVATKVGTSKTGRTLIISIVIGVIFLVMFPILVIISLFTDNENYNNMLIQLCFNDASLPEKLTEYEGEYIENFRKAFTDLDIVIDGINEEIEPNTLDDIRIKATFYVQYLSAIPTYDDELLKTFVNSFVKDNEMIKTENLDEAYQKVAELTQIEIDKNKSKYIDVVYNLVKYGVGEIGDIGNINAEGFASPLGDDWRNQASSEFGNRIHPITGKASFHGGIDLAYAGGTPIQSPKDGIVIRAKFGVTGYGHEIQIDHGDGVISLYGHCKDIYVHVGDSVVQGQIIGTVGTTGSSTGNHLHYEIRVNGQAVNPRLFLP